MFPFWQSGVTCASVALTLVALTACDDDKSGTTDRMPPAHAIDGDTIALEGKPHALAGIDAPELGQRCASDTGAQSCGEAAAFALAKLIALDKPDCEPVGENTEAYHCGAGGENLAEILLAQGHVVATADAPETYRVMQQRAADEGIGIWRGDFILPETWRAGQQIKPKTDGAAQCPVVAFEDDKGAWYITPTHPHSIEITEQTGKEAARFCSDEDARAAGYVWLPIDLQ